MTFTRHISQAFYNPFCIRQQLFQWHNLSRTLIYLIVSLYPIDILKHLNVSISFKVRFDRVIPASLAGIFLHPIPLSPLYLNPPCPSQKLKCVLKLIDNFLIFAKIMIKSACMVTRCFIAFMAAISSRFFSTAL